MATKPPNSAGSATSAGSAAKPAPAPEPAVDFAIMVDRMRPRDTGPGQRRLQPIANAKPAYVAPREPASTRAGDTTTASQSMRKNRHEDGRENGIERDDNALPHRVDANTPRETPITPVARDTPSTPATVAAIACMTNPQNPAARGTDAGASIASGPATGAGLPLGGPRRSTFANATAETGTPLVINFGAGTSLGTAIATLARLAAARAAPDNGTSTTPAGGMIDVVSANQAVSATTVADAGAGQDSARDRKSVV